MMIISRPALAVAAALAALAAPAALGQNTPSPAPLPLTASQTADGAMLIGNPAARTRLVEYNSYTCRHCATFAAAAHDDLLRDHLTPGTTAVEFRNMVRDPVDMAAALLARCGGPARFYGIHRAILAGQDAWLGKARAATPAQQKAWSSGTIEARLVAIGRGTGLTALVGKHGITAAAANACLTAKPARDALLAMTETARTLGVQGTPSFLINGNLVEAHDWQNLKPLLAAAN